MNQHDLASPESPTSPAADYERTVQVAAPAESVFDAVSSPSGLTAWWTQAAGSGATGGELVFTMSEPEPLVVRVDEATPPTLVRWTVTSCPFLVDWVGTRPTFTVVSLSADTAEVHFRHHGLTAELDCIEMCTRGWDHYLSSLRSFVETGHGMPRGSSEDLARRS